MQYHDNPNSFLLFHRTMQLASRSLLLKVTNDLLLLVQHGDDASPDQLGALGGIDGGPDPGLSVVIDDGSGLLDGKVG